MNKSHGCDVTWLLPVIEKKWMTETLRYLVQLGAVAGANNYKIEENMGHFDKNVEYAFPRWTLYLNKTTKNAKFRTPCVTSKLFWRFPRMFLIVSLVAKMFYHWPRHQSTPHRATSEERINYRWSFRSNEKSFEFERHLSCHKSVIYGDFNGFLWHFSHDNVQEHTHLN